MKFIQHALQYKNFNSKNYNGKKLVKLANNQDISMVWRMRSRKKNYKTFSNIFTSNNNIKILSRLGRLTHKQGIDIYLFYSIKRAHISCRHEYAITYFMLSYILLHITFYSRYFICRYTSFWAFKLLALNKFILGRKCQNVWRWRDLRCINAWSFSKSP